MAENNFNITYLLQKLQEKKHYKDLSWSGTFEEYIQVVRTNPLVTRNAFQRMYDMILTYGTEEYIDFKKTVTRYNSTALL